MKRDTPSRPCPARSLKTLSKSAANARARELRKRGWDARFVSVDGVGSVLTKKRTPDLPAWALATGGILLALLVLKGPRP
jgi:hypothetical protein